MIIADFGSGNTCKNDLDYGKHMIRSLAEIDIERKCIIKWQLFENAGDNIPLRRDIFAKLHEFGMQVGFQVTASVFDKLSLDYLVRFEVPFVKIANNPKLYPLMFMVPIDIPVIKSVGNSEEFQPGDMCCVSEYPANPNQYEKTFKKAQLREGISDHTENWYLYKKYKPQIYEFHFCLDDSEGLDAGTFARRPCQVREIL